MASGDAEYSALLKVHLGVPMTPDEVENSNAPASLVAGSGVAGSGIRLLDDGCRESKGTSIPRRSASKIPCPKGPSSFSSAHRTLPASKTTCLGSTVPKSSIRTQELLEPAEMECSLDEDCPSPVLIGQINHRFEARSSDEKQFSPVISALKQSQQPKKSQPGASMWERASSPVLQVVDANLPPLQTRIPSRNGLRASKGSGSGSDIADSNVNVFSDLSFNPRDSVDSGTPTAFQAQKVKGGSAADTAQHGKDATGIQLLTPVAPCTAFSEAPDCGLVKEEPSRQAVTQAALHPLFQQASAVQSHVPVFHIPSTQDDGANAQGANAVDQFSSPHVKMMKPSLFVNKQEPLSNPLPAHAPSNLIQNAVSDQPIGTPPYAKLMRHLHGHDALPLSGEPTLFVKTKSDVPEESPVVAGDAQPFCSEGTPDGRKFGDLLSAINAHQYHSPAPAMAAIFTEAEMRAEDSISHAEGHNVSSSSADEVETPPKVSNAVPPLGCESDASQAGSQAISTGSAHLKVSEPQKAPVADTVSSVSTSPEGAVVVESSFQTEEGLPTAEDVSRSTLFLTPEGRSDSPDTLADCTTCMSSQTVGGDDAVHEVSPKCVSGDLKATPPASENHDASFQPSYDTKEIRSVHGTPCIEAESPESHSQVSSTAQLPEVGAVSFTSNDEGLPSAGTPDAPGFVDLLSAINAHQYYSPAPAMMAKVTEEEAAPVEPSEHEHSLSLSCEQQEESLQTDASSMADSTADVSSGPQHHVAERIPDMFSMGNIVVEAVQPLELQVTQDVVPVALSPAEGAIVEQSSFHTASVISLNQQKSAATPFLTPGAFVDSPDDFTACKTHMSSDKHEKVDPSDVSQCEHVHMHLAVKDFVSTVSDDAVKVSLHVGQCDASAGDIVDSPADSSHRRYPCQSSVPYADLEFIAESPNIGTSESCRIQDQPNLSAALWSFMQRDDSCGSGGIAENILHSPAPLMSDSVAGFSFMLSPPSESRESVASVCFNDQQSHSPVLRISDQQSQCESEDVPGDHDKVNMLSPTKTQSPVKLVDLQPAGHLPFPQATPAASSHTTSMLSPVLAHVEALKTLSKKKDSLRQSYQKGERAEELEITLPSDLDTPQCSQMVRDIENALRDSECDGHSDQGSYTQWLSETGIINLLTPTGLKDAALQSVFQKAQISDEAQQAADDMSRMEMENTALHNMECAALQQEQMKLEQENESLRQEKVQAEQDNACLRQEKVEMQQHNECLQKEKMQLEARLRDALEKHRLQQGTPTMQGKSHNAPISAASTLVKSSVLAPENSDTEILALIEGVKELERHVVIVCQRSQQQDASGGSFEKTMSYLEQLDKKLHSGKVSRTRLVAQSLAHLRDRIKWAQESLPELIGEFDKSMHKVSRRSMELASMKELSRAALDQEQSAVGELEEHLKYVGVSMRTHLHSIFVEVIRWPGLIQRLLVHKATQDVLQDEQFDTAADIDSFPAQFVAADEDDIPLSKQLLTAADRVVNIMDSISIDCQKLVMPQKCPSPCLGTPVVAVNAGTSPHVMTQGESPSLALPTGMTVSDLTPPRQVYESFKQDNHRLNALNLLDNPLFTNEDLQSSSASYAERQQDDTSIARASSMPASFAPSMPEGCQEEMRQFHSSGLGASDTDTIQSPVLQCSVSVQTSPVLPGEDMSDTSPESCRGGSVSSTRRRDAQSERVQFLCNALQVKASPFLPRARRGERHTE